MANGRSTVAECAARQLANATKTRAQWGGITPRWLIPFLPWTPAEAGIYRLNRVKETRGATAASSTASVESSPPKDRDAELPETFVDYEEDPREYFLNAVSTILDVQTRVSDLYSRPFDQTQEQLRLLIEKVKERQEYELVNNVEYGLINNVHPSMKVRTRKGAPTPDDLDELISKVWKEPAFFLAHPRAIAAFGRECTRRGVPPATVNIFGSPFITWRGLPIVPTDKLWVDGDDKAATTNILLMRVGEKKQGVVGLFQPGLPGEQTPGLSVRFMGITPKGISQYPISLYCSAAVLVPDALGVLENVEVGHYHEYKYWRRRRRSRSGARAAASRPPKGSPRRPSISSSRRPARSRPGARLPRSRSRRLPRRRRLRLSAASRRPPARPAGTSISSLRTSPRGRTSPGATPPRRRRPAPGRRAPTPARPTRTRSRPRAWADAPSRSARSARTSRSSTRSWTATVWCGSTTRPRPRSRGRSSTAS